jgi:hypothetical protein
VSGKGEFLHIPGRMAANGDGDNRPFAVIGTCLSPECAVSKLNGVDDLFSTRQGLFHMNSQFDANPGEKGRLFGLKKAGCSDEKGHPWSGAGQGLV